MKSDYTQGGTLTRVGHTGVPGKSDTRALHGYAD